jgi:tRNA(Arg) A34 adenosine deaminase TadA
MLATLETLSTIPALTSKMESVFSLCLNEASKSNLLFRHGCIATYGGKIMCKGCNTTTSSTDNFIRNSCTCHAEINVLRRMFQKYQRQYKEAKIRKIFRKTTLYISRLTNAGNSQNSAPCVDCLSMIQKFEIKRIIFYNGDDYNCIKPNDYKTDHFSHGKLYINKMTDR